MLVEDIKPAHYKSLNEVKGDVKDILAREKGADKVEEFLDKVLDIVFNTNNIDTAASKLNLTAKTSKLLSKKRYAEFVQY